EAQQLADEVPRDEGLEPEVRLEAGPADGLALVDDAQDAAPAPLEPDYAVADAPAAADNADEAAIDALSVDSLSLEALPADDAETGAPDDDAAAALDSDDIGEISFDGFSIEGDDAPMSVEGPGDAGTATSTGGIEL